MPTFKVTEKIPEYRVHEVEAETWEQAKETVEAGNHTCRRRDWGEAEVIFVDSLDGKESFYEV